MFQMVEYILISTWESSLRRRLELRLDRNRGYTKKEYKIIAKSIGVFPIALIYRQSCMKIAQAAYLKDIW